MRIGSNMSRGKKYKNAYWYFGTSNVCKYFADCFACFVIYFNSE